MLAVCLRGVTNNCIVVPLQCICTVYISVYVYINSIVQTLTKTFISIFGWINCSNCTQYQSILIVNMTKALKCLAFFCKVLIKIKQMPRGLPAILTEVEQVFIYMKFESSFQDGLEYFHEVKKLECKYQVFHHLCSNEIHYDLFPCKDQAIWFLYGI